MDSNICFMLLRRFIFYLNRSIILLVVLLSFLSITLIAQVKIKERVDIGTEQQSDTSSIRASELSTAFSYTMPFNGVGDLIIWSYDYLYPEDTELSLNGTVIIDDIIRQVNERSPVVLLGAFSQGQTLTFTMKHQDESSWLVEECYRENDGCNARVGIIFSHEPVCGQMFDPEHPIPMNVTIDLDFWNSTEEKILLSDYGGSFVYGLPPLRIRARYASICWLYGSVPLPEGTTFTFTITDGQEYAILYDSNSGNEGTSLSGIPQDNGQGWVDVKVIAETASLPVNITIEAQTTAPGVNTVSGIIEIRPNDLIFDVSKSTMLYGDTMKFDVWKKMPDGSSGPLASGTLLEYTTIEGLGVGFLYSPDSSQVGGIWGEYTTAMYAALGETPPSDTEVVKVQVRAFEPVDPCPDCPPVKIVPTTPITSTALSKKLSRAPNANKLITNSISQQVTKNADGSYSFKNRNKKGKITESSTGDLKTMTGDYYPLVGILPLKIIKQNEILLGQSKYYYVMDDGERSSIQETTIPQLPGGGINSDIWTGDPVIAITDTSYGKKLGVYWEKKDSTGADLPTGMIRLIGRYWRVDSVYKVGLNTTYNSKLLRKTIEVKKPTKLGNSHNTAQDCFGNTINLDSIIIKFAGENGIPPQLIKGQMEQESQPIFTPSWRYEPAFDYSYQKEKNRTVFPIGAPFIKTATNPKGNGTWPSHTYATPAYYDTSAKSIAYCLADENNNFQNYRILAKDSIMGFDDLTNELRNIITKKRTDNPKATATFLQTIVYDSLAREIKDTSNTLGKDYDRIAQTRIVSSYGFLQMMYTTAISDKFGIETEERYGPTGTKYMQRNNSTLYPEKLNELEYLMPRYSDYLLKRLNWMFTSRIPSSQWNTTKGENNYVGFEACWKGALQQYNPYDPNYANNVISKMNSYLPK